MVGRSTDQNEGVLFLIRSNWYRFHSVASTILPFTPKSDKHLISSNNITPESNIKVMGIRRS